MAVVRLLRETWLPPGHAPHPTGEVIEIPDDVAERLIREGAAEAVDA